MGNEQVQQQDDPDFNAWGFRDSEYGNGNCRNSSHDRRTIYRKHCHRGVAGQWFCAGGGSCRTDDAAALFQDESKDINAGSGRHLFITAIGTRYSLYGTFTFIVIGLAAIALKMKMERQKDRQ